MQEMMGMNPQIPTIKELWKNEKSKYRHWVILLAIGLFVIFGLTLASFVLNLINRSGITNTIQEELTRKTNDTTGEIQRRADELYTRYNIIYPSLILISLVAGIIWYFISLVEVYKHKNFAKLSQWPTIVVGIGALISGVQLITYAISSRPSGGMFTTQGAVFSFASRIVYILIWFAASSPISKVRRLFIISDRLEKMKNDPRFQAMQKQMSSALQGGYMPNGPLGPLIARDGQSAQSPPPQTPAKTKSNQQEKVDPELERLKRLPLEKLREVALRLSISGHKTMKKDELIEAIMRVAK